MENEKLEWEVPGVSGVPLPKDGVVEEGTINLGIGVMPIITTNPGPNEPGKAPEKKRINTSIQLQEHQKHTLARLMVAGVPVHEIAFSLRHTPQYIKKCMQDPQVKELAQLYAGQMVAVEVGYKYEMASRAKRAYAALDDCLTHPDAKIRQGAYRDVFKAIAPPMEVQTEHSVSASAPTLDPVAQRELAKAVHDISSTMREITEYNTKHGKPDMRKHLIENDELPGPQDVHGFES